MSSQPTSAPQAAGTAYAAQALGGIVSYFADLLYNTDNSSGFATEAAVKQLTVLWTNAIGLRRDAAH